MPIKPEDLPERPMTATFVSMEAEGDPDVFAFLCIFPTGTRFTIQAKFPPGIVDTKLARDFTNRVVAACLERRDDKSAGGTNWVSAMAAIQRMIIDFNNKRGAREATIAAPDGRPLQ